MESEGKVMKVAIIHYWLIGMRGGEAVLESLCELFPQADIYTHAYDATKISKKINSKKIHTTFISRLPYSKTRYQAYLPLMPLALEMLDLSEYDLVISSESGPAKGVIVRPDALHICYVHSPMRYIWDQFHVYRKSAGFIKRKLMPLIAHYLRGWDVTSAARVDLFVANSNFVQKRISKYYRRKSVVIAPPVDVESFSAASVDEIGDYYLWVGELVTYKRADIAVAALCKMGKKLVVIGSGEVPPGSEYANSSLIDIKGRVSDLEMRHYMARCKALIFPGVEDFGIVPVEVMASGRPVIAYAAGGALDTVVHGKTGILFDEQSVDGLIEAIEEFETNLMHSLEGDDILAHAGNFSQVSFTNKFEQLLSSNGIEAGVVESNALAVADITRVVHLNLKNQAKAPQVEPSVTSTTL